MQLKLSDIHFHLRAHPIFQGLQATFNPGLTLINGNNGAGKSTLFKIISGLCEPQIGQVLLNGRSLYDTPRTLLPTINLVGAEPSLYPYLTVKENFKIIARLKNLSSYEFKECYQEAVTEFHLSEIQTTLFSKLSDGFKKRVMLACAFLTRPHILLLDEPCTFLDSEQRTALWKKLQAFATAQRIILINSHYSAEILSFCHYHYQLKDGNLMLLPTASWRKHPIVAPLYEKEESLC